MVLLTVKGTIFPDEFTFECTASTSISPELARQLCHIQNARHQVKLQLLSARELLEEARRKRGLDASGSTDDALTSYGGLIEEVSTRMKDTNKSVTLEEFDHAAEKLREMTEKLFPGECSLSEGGRDAAVERLYALHDNPDIDEDYRLVVYHCRAILDKRWKQQELQREDQAGLWFCGKLMEGTISKYSGRNEKSRLTVKVHPKDGAAPSIEPRMSYDDQRALFERMRQRREEYKTLEESELREKVLAQSRGRVVLDVASVSGGVRVDMSRLRPICPRKEENDVT
ncbi:hypothetical protein TcG_08303 [Trypanosoma cruzi]|uniref:Uncharacterized protein n=2 Tax=Trypanosoma cruzi TaxID=5693 RepID=V5B6Z0_TRYCR|nr:hypothetical protein TCDM_02292 [Trypanosoma cruzi Dm28c]KAF8286940.1 putative Protein of unknown function (DUF2870) [Trypanosoma cruzi]PBJ74908.1 hypothetical protein BCY84_11839 [Trypanosoma cruzi cruzi]PWU87524.1 hypothetical protein C4B63_90g58 [Trypanosoma cruzi]RNF13581.1 hypothetical protein TcG_08303 [Trypanosoma cruzi]